MDPGSDGALVVVTAAGPIYWESFRRVGREHKVEADVAAAKALLAIGGMPLVCAAVEKVSANPGWSRKGCFAFGRSTGAVHAALAFRRALRVEAVLPKRWQELYQYGGGATPKERAKLAVEALWPGRGLPPCSWDAALIAEWCRRTFPAASGPRYHVGED